MRQNWRRLPGWRRVLVVLDVLALLNIVAGVIFNYPAAWWGIPMVVVVACTYVVLQVDRRRAVRDGSYWGPKE